MSKKEINFMKKKSIDSFLFALEIFNKPTIDYRLEGCVFFLCNAWELLFKARLLSQDKRITFKDNEGRTYGITECMRRVLTNEHDPIRINLSVIIGLRNTATHLVIPEYEADYIPFLAYNVRAYTQKLYEYFDVSINRYIKTDFLSLFTAKTNDHPVNVIGKYGKNVRDAFIQKKGLLQSAYDSTDSEVALNVQVNLVRVNRENLADVKFYRSNDPADPHVKVIRQEVNPNITHTLTHHQIASRIDQEIKKNGILFTPLRKPIPTEKNPDPKLFTTNALDILLRKYNWRENQEFCHKTPYGSSCIYKYSDKLVTTIIAMIMNNPNIVVDINNQNKRKAKKKNS